MNRGAAILSLVLLVSNAMAEDLRYRVIDRREVDGTVVLIRRVPREATGAKPFLSARHWELTPASDFFRVKEMRIPARFVSSQGDPPAITMRDGGTGANHWTNAFGGTPSTFFEPGEIVRLVRMNAAFKIVRLDVESVCRPSALGRRLRGRVDVVLSGQVNAATFDEANAAVGQVLEPVELARVLESCDPETAQPPLALRPGMPVSEVRDRLGDPIESSASILDYGVVRIEVRDALVTRVIVPAVD